MRSRAARRDAVVLDDAEPFTDAGVERATAADVPGSGRSRYSRPLPSATPS